jgi:hypothetical protein
MGLLAVAGFAFYGAALGMIIMGIVKLVWGAAPAPAGYIDWSWYIVQGACVLTVLMLAQFISRVIETKHMRRRRRVANNAADANAADADGSSPSHTPMIASTKFSRFYVVVLIALTVVILLLLASWGIFLA